MKNEQSSADQVAFALLGDGSPEATLVVSKRPYSLERFTASQKTTYSPIRPLPTVDVSQLGLASVQTLIEVGVLIKLQRKTSH